MSDGNNVTLKDVYDAVNRLEDKFEKRIKPIETDVNELQKFQNRAMGVLTVFSTFIGLIATFVWNRIIGSDQ